jgi:hypothetical protein
VACWAHVRRKFHDVHLATASPLASEALDRIGALFGIERPINGKPPDERRHARDTQARPLLDDLAAFFDAALAKISGKSELAAAIRYARTEMPSCLRAQLEIL